MKKSLELISEPPTTPMFRRLKSRSLRRFAAVGCMNTAVDFAVFTILRSVFDVHYLLCQVAGYTMGIINSYFFNKVWTFENKAAGWDIRRQFVQFVLVNLISLAISLLGLKILSGYWHINVYFAKVLVTGLALMFNYLGYTYWVFDTK